MRSTLAFQQLPGGVAITSGDRQKKMLRRDKLIFEVVRLFERLFEDIVERAAHMLLGKSLHFGQTPNLALDLLSKSVGRYAQPRQQGRHDAVSLLHERRQEVYWLNLLVFVPRGNFLGALYCFLRLDGHFLESQ